MVLLHVISVPGSLLWSKALRAAVAAQPKLRVAAPELIPSSAKPRRVVQYQDEYGYVLRMVVIMLLMPTDTSEAERIFSLMNNIKSKTRSTLGNDVLVSLMMWHYVWGSVERADFPYKAVLDQIRADASAEGISMYGHKLADSKTV